MTRFHFVRVCLLLAAIPAVRAAAQIPPQPAAAGPGYTPVNAAAGNAPLPVRRAATPSPAPAPAEAVAAGPALAATPPDTAASGQARRIAPADLLAAAPAEAWRRVAADRTLVMQIAGGGQVVIELAPEFAPQHIANMILLAQAHWWDGTSINRVQDNYVVQWGDATERKAPSRRHRRRPARRV